MLGFRPSLWEHKMALDNSWMNSGREQQREINPVEMKRDDMVHHHQDSYLNNQKYDECGPSNRGGLIKIPSSNFKAQTNGNGVSENKCTMIPQQQQQPQQQQPEQQNRFTQTEQQTRFTQTEQNNRFPFVDNSCKSDIPAQPVFDHNNLQPPRNMYEENKQFKTEPICHPVVTPSINFPKQKENEEKFKQEMGTKEFPFCYNMNMLQKVQDDKCYRLDMCGQQFSYNYAFMNQVSLTPFKCDVCGLVFGHSSLLNHHKRVHTGEKSYGCEVCGLVFPQASELRSHKTVHAENKHKCEVCGIEFADQARLKKHGKFHLNQRSKCDSCEVTFPENSGDVKPLRRVHGVRKCQKCNGSGMIFITSPSKVQKPFQCSICENTFSRYSSLWSHKRLHSGEKPYKCEVCGMAFAKAAYLKNHRRIHTGEKPYKCEVCDMAFSQGPHLKNHERIHTGEKPYLCEVCHKAFSRHSTLWNHRRIHTGEKPYRCEICGSAFSQGTHLKNHKKVHTGEKPYRCDVCDVGFSDRFALKRHKGIHNNQNNANNHNSHNHNTHNNGLELPVYKCEVGQVAFPGCSRPQDNKPIHAA